MKNAASTIAIALIFAISGAAFAEGGSDRLIERRVKQAEAVQESSKAEEGEIETNNIERK